MDITSSTKQLVSQVQLLKSKYSDLCSISFIDFYCQCREGSDYLFGSSIGKQIRLVDILQWFLQCVDHQKPIPLIELMWKDIAGPTLGAYQQDERIERGLLKAFISQELKEAVQTWDLQRTEDGGVNLILRNLLNDIDKLESQSTIFQDKVKG
ncbi:hypothetical protein PCC7424_5705 (plasmid) [Gloeothece citriformis PCC 7424]|uniref:Uncharacterized protein n=1 Tax=Gloeothece citriformis (strain PCC 7424) TaxID=65393 RepID=B7KLU8_GLOC7|nr:hypothetical protein [Gloeothece citriformis]ACK73770.1 hypothetical protein PCC7424_5705 [Gloeothece citriformis PCC 7424]